MKNFPITCYDNFYDNPDQVREFALSLDHTKVSGFFPGSRTQPLSTFDKESTVNEAELVYETFNNTTFKSSKKSIKENLGSASRSVGTTKSTKPIIETNDAYKRMQELAFYDVKH